MLWLTVPDATTSIPSTSWEHLAGTANETTIKGSDDTPLVFSPYPNTQQTLIFFNNQLHLACRGKTDENYPDNFRAHVARREDDGSWTLLGGDQGLRTSASDNIDRYTQALYVYNGQLYAAYVEDESGNYNQHIRISRWNESTSSWTHLTTGSRGIHSDFVPGYESFRLVGVYQQNGDIPAFTQVGSDLFLAFIEQDRWTPSASPGQTDTRRAISKLSGSSFSRVLQFTAGEFEVTAENDDGFYFYRRSVSSNQTLFMKFDGSAVSTVNLDTGKDGSLLSGNTVPPWQHNLWYEDGTFYSLYQHGFLNSNSEPASNILLKTSTNGGQSFSSPTNLGALPTNFKFYFGGRVIDGTQYALTRESGSGTGFSGQPIESKVFRKDDSSWTALGGGNLGTSEDKNVSFEGQIFGTWINGVPYVMFTQSSFYDSGGAGAIQDDKIYIAWTAP